MGSLLQSTLNTRALPTGNLRFIRSDYPGKLSEAEVQWLLKNNITTIIDLREEKEYAAKPCILEDRDEFVYHHLPVTGGGDTPKSPDAVKLTYLGMLESYAAKHPEVDINIIIPKEENIKKVLENEYLTGEIKQR